MQTIKKSIEINASPEKVWDVIINEEFNKSWFAEFSEGTRVETDWEVGSKATFIDHTDCGMITKIITKKPNEELTLEFIGIVNKGEEDFDSEEAQKYKGGHENYYLNGSQGSTHLSIEADMGEEYFDQMSLSWDRALDQIKVLAELLE